MVDFYKREIVMKKKTLYFLLIIAAFTAIYMVAAGVYFSYMYMASNYYENVDTLFEVFFYLFSIIGIIAVSFYMKGHYTKKRLLTAYCISIFAGVGITFLLFLPLSKTLFTIIVLLFSILSGTSQGCYVFLLTLFLPKSSRCMGLGVAASLSVILNSLVSLINDGLFVQTIYAVVLYLVVAVIGCLVLTYTFKHYSLDDFKEAEAESKGSNSAPIWNTKTFLVTGIFITLSWAIQSLGFYFPFNGAMILNISNETLRLTNILGLLIGGYLMSRDKKLGSISSLIILATPMLYILLQAQAGITLLVFILSYFFTGFLSVYRYGIIADMSDSVDSNGNAMTFFCAFGLAFGRLGESIGGLLGIKYSGNTLVLLTITSFFLVTAVAFFIFHYFRLFTPVPQVIKSYSDKITSFKVKYDISSREMDVLELLIDGDSNAEIADKLYVSENTVRFHVSNLLKKTGCKNRKEIAALFHNE